MEFASDQFNEASHVWTTNPGAKNDFSVEGEVVWIRLTQGKCACVDLKNWERVKEYRWFAHKCRYALYAKTHIGGRKDGRTVGLWHIVLQVDPSQLCDHGDRNGLNNLLSNVSAATNTQNQRNRIGWGSTGYKGVKPYGTNGKFRATVVVDRQAIHLGVFSNAILAACAYDSGAREHFGEYARLNFP